MCITNALRAGLERFFSTAFRGAEWKITSVARFPWGTMKTGSATVGGGLLMAACLAAGQWCSGVYPCSIACLLRAGQKQRACIAASPCFVWSGTRRTVCFCGARFFGRLEFTRKFGVPQLATINKSASYGAWWNRIRDFLDVSTLSVCK